MHDDIAFKLERATLLERARLEKHWTKKQLAEKAGYDEKTLYNLLSGSDLQSKTIFDFCQALEIPVPQPSQRKIEVADERLGAYSRSIYDEYEGDYHIYRPSFSKPELIYRYVMKINWDEVDSSFRFVTFYKRDLKELTGAKTHSGPVSISAITNLVHFVVTFRGSVRLVTVTKMRTADGIMRGSMATHFEDVNFFRPTLSSIVIKKLDPVPLRGDLLDDIKMLDADDADFIFARDQLAITQKAVLNVCFSPGAHMGEPNGRAAF